MHRNSGGNILLAKLWPSRVKVIQRQVTGIRVVTSAPPEMPKVPLPWKKHARETLVHSTLLAALALRAESSAWMASWGTSAPGLPRQGHQCIQSWTLYNMISCVVPFPCWQTDLRHEG